MPRAPDPDHDQRLGVLAFGDSITNGGGELQWGVALQSWALWAARGLGVPYTGYAVDGARVPDVLRLQIPAYQRTAAVADGRYDLGCLYIGVNDVRSPDWSGEAFAADFERALTFIAARCDRTLTVTAPLRLGVPPAARAHVTELNAAIRAAAARHGAPVLELEDFGARNQVMVDRVHPTALGQVAIAERALAVLERDGLPTRVRPSSLINVQRSRKGSVRGDWTYLYRSLKLRAALPFKQSRRPRRRPSPAGRNPDVAQSGDLHGRSDDTRPRA